MKEGHRVFFDERVCGEIGAFSPFRMELHDVTVLVQPPCFELLYVLELQIQILNILEEGPLQLAARGLKYPDVAVHGTNQHVVVAKDVLVLQLGVFAFQRPHVQTMRLFHHLNRIQHTRYLVPYLDLKYDLLV